MHGPLLSSRPDHCVHYEAYRDKQESPPPIKIGMVFVATIKNMVFGGGKFALSCIMRKMVIAAMQNIQPPKIDSFAFY